MAYADFVTALMAFFLLLWLISMVSEEKKAMLSTYFTHFSIFDNKGESIIGEGDNDDSVVSIDLQESSGEDSGDALMVYLSKLELIEKLRKDIEKKLADVADQVLVEIFEGGVKIQLVDKEGKPMFLKGSADPSPLAKKILALITSNIKELTNKLSIEGHTDALSYATDKYTNWELSTDRASSARKELEQNGLNPDRLVRVSGLAATEPLIKEDVYDTRNRRISILLLYNIN